MHAISTLSPRLFLFVLLLAATACGGGSSGPSVTAPATVALPTLTAEGALPAMATATPEAGAEGNAIPTPDAAGELPSYPAPVGAYPIPEPEISTPDPAAPYPPPEPTAQRVVVQFDEPISASATTVSGTGLPNLKLIVVNVSRNGEIIGRGTIGEDGTFDIAVSTLEAGTLIGAMPDDLEGTGYTPTDLEGCAGCRDMPLLGLILAQTLVQ